MSIRSDFRFLPVRKTGVILPLLALVSAGGLRAAVRTWDGGGATNNWNVAANWDADTLPVAGDDLVFPAGIAAGDKSTANNLAAGTAFGSLTFGDSGFTIAGNAFTLNGGITVQSAANAACTVSAALTLGAAQTFQTGDADAELTVSGGLNLNARLLAVQGNGTIRLNGIISGTTAASAISKSGSNELILGGLNTFAGPVTLNAGTLTATRNSSLGSSAAATTVNGGTLRFASATGIVCPENLTLTAGTLASELGSHTLTGILTLNGAGQRTVSVGTGAELILSGAVGGTAGLLHTGAGSLQLADNGSVTVAVETRGAELHLSKNPGSTAISSALAAGDGLTPVTVFWRNGDQVDDEASLTALAGSVLDFSGNGDTIKSLTLTGASAINAATLTVQSAITGGGEPVTSLLSGKVELPKTTVTWTVVPGLAPVDFDVAAQLTSDGASERFGAGLMRLSGSFAVDSLALFAGQTEVTGTQTGALQLKGGSLSGTGSTGAVASFGAGGDVGPGTLAAAAGRLTVNGSFALDSTCSFSAGLVSSLSPGTGYDQLRVNGPVSIGGALLNVAMLPGFTGSGGEEFVIIDNDGTDPVAGVFNGLAEGALVSVGPQFFRISYAGGSGNDVVLTWLPHTGVTKTWDGGAGSGNPAWSIPANWAGDVAPVPGDSLVFPAGSSVNDFPAGTAFDSLTFNGMQVLQGNRLALVNGISAPGGGNVGLPVTLLANQTFAAPGPANLVFSALAPIDTGASVLTFQSGDTGGPAIIVNSVISGAGSLVKTGPSSLTLNAVNTFTGTVTISGGLITAASGALGSTGAGTTVAAGTALFTGSTAEPLTVSGVIDSIGSPVVLSGPVVFPAGASARVVLGNVTTGVLSGTISGSGNATFEGTGEVLISGTGANTWSGTATLLNGSVVRVEKSGPFQALPPAVILNTGARLTVNNAGAFAPATSYTCGAATVTTISASNTLGPVSLAVNSQIDITNSAVLTLAGNLTAVGASIHGSLAISGPGRTWHISTGSPSLGVTVDGPVSAATADAGLVITGGFWNLSGSVSLPGGIQVNSGFSTLVLDGPSNSTAVVLNGGSLKGSGSTGPVSSLPPNSFITPAGTLTTGSFTGRSTLFLNASATHPPAGLTLSGLRVLGSVTLNNTDLEFTPDTVSPPLSGDILTIIDNDNADPVTGTFAGLPEGGSMVIGGLTYRISYQGGDGNDVTLSVPGSGLTKVWDGGGGNNLWSNPLNWSTDQAPAAGDALVFPAGAPQPVSQNDLTGINFASLTITQSGFQAAGAPLTLLSGLTVDVSTQAVLGFSISVPVAQTWTFLSGSCFLLPGTTTFASGTLTLSTAPAGSFFASGSLTGTAGIVKTGGGQVVLSGDNTFVGTFDLQQGSVRIEHDHALGSPAIATFVRAGAFLMLEGTTLNIAEPVILESATLLSIPAVQAQCSGPVSFSGACTVNSVSGRLVLSGPDSGFGSVSIAGLVRFAGTDPCQWTGGTSIAPSGFVELAKSPGVTALPGNVTVGSGGRIEVLASDQIADTAAISLGTGAYLVLPQTGTTETIGSVDLSGGGLETQGTSTLTIDGSLTVHAGPLPSSLTGRMVVANSTSPGSGRPWDIAPDSFLIAFATLSGDELRKTGGGELRCLGDNSVIHVRVQDGVLGWFGNCPACLLTIEHGTLQGTGQAATVTATSASAARIEPGQGPGPGILPASNFIGGPGLTLALEFAGTTRGTLYDGLNILNNMVALQNTLLDISVSYPAAAGDAFTIVDNAGPSAIGGFFATPSGVLLENSTFQAGGHTFRITYQGGDGNDVVLTKIEPAPPTVTAFSIAPGTGPDAGQNVVTISGSGSPGQQYAIEFSTDLVNWSLRALATAGPSGALNINFTESPAQARRFYRFAP